MDHLDQLENRSVHILREAYANFKNLGMLWSIGKDSTVLLWLARKAFFGHVPIPLIHIDTSYKIPEMIEYRDRLALEWNLTMIYGQNRQALDEKRTFPDGAIDRIACCKALKTDALKHTLSGEWPRYRLNHAKRVYELDRNTEPFTGVIVGRARRRGGQPVEGALLLAAHARSRSGTSAISRRSSGISSRPSSRRARTCGSTRCSTGPSSTSGSTSSGRRSRRSRSTTTRATAGGTARWAAIPAPTPVESDARNVDEIIVELRSRASSPTSPSAPAGRRTRTAAAGWRRSGATGTCERRRARPLRRTLTGATSAG